MSTWPPPSPLHLASRRPSAVGTRVATGMDCARIALHQGEAMEEQNTTKTMKVAWSIVERGQGKSFWTRVGVGFVNRDGSLTLRLDAIPISGTIQVREWEPYDRRGESSDGPGRAKPKSLAPDTLL